MRYATLSDKGGRAENQDTVGLRETPEGLAAMICDGLGGHRGGEMAAQAALAAALDAPGSPGERLCAANEAVLEEQGRKDCPSMRTTAALLLIQGRVARWAHCGDTRLYRARAGKMEQLTLDHSVPQMLVRAGEIGPEEIRYHEDRARLTRAMGVADFRWDEAEAEVLPGDIYLLATDGLWEPVTEERMLALLCDNPREYLHKLEQALLAAGAPDQDNYTALAVFIDE